MSNTTVPERLQTEETSTLYDVYVSALSRFLDEIKLVSNQEPYIFKIRQADNQTLTLQVLFGRESTIPIEYRIHMSEDGAYENYEMVFDTIEGEG